jgi:ribosomal protein L37AE/L43A
MFSRDINKRIQENQKFLKYYNRAENWTKNKFNMIKGLKTYKYFTCPSCKQTVRVPRGKGRVNVICPKCSTKFIKST